MLNIKEKIGLGTLERNFVYKMAMSNIKSFNELIEELYECEDEFENHPYDFDLWVEQEIKNFENSSIDWCLNWMEKRTCNEMAFKFFKFLIEKQTILLNVDISGYTTSNQ